MRSFRKFQEWETEKNYFLPLVNKKITKPTTKATKIKAHHIPALKMVPIASQLVKVKSTKTVRESKVYFFMMIYFFNYYGFKI